MYGWTTADGPVGTVVELVKTSVAEPRYDPARERVMTTVSIEILGWHQFGFDDAG